MAFILSYTVVELYTVDRLTLVYSFDKKFETCNYHLGKNMLHSYMFMTTRDYSKAAQWRGKLYLMYQLWSEKLWEINVLVILYKVNVHISFLKMFFIHLVILSISYVYSKDPIVSFVREKTGEKLFSHMFGHAIWPTLQIHPLSCNLNTCEDSEVGED